MTPLTIAGVGLNTPLSPLWDAVKAGLATNNMKGLLSGIGTITSGAAIYLNTDDIPAQEGGLNAPWGRLVLSPTQTLWPQTDRPGETRRVSFLVRAEFNNFKAPGYRVDQALEAVHTEALGVLQGWAPSLVGLLVAFPLYRNVPPQQAPAWDGPTGTWWTSAQWRCEVIEGSLGIGVTAPGGAFVTISQSDADLRYRQLSALIPDSQVTKTPAVAKPDITGAVARVWAITERATSQLITADALITISAIPVGEFQFMDIVQDATGGHLATFAVTGGLPALHWTEGGAVPTERPVGNTQASYMFYNTGARVDAAVTWHNVPTI